MRDFFFFILGVVYGVWGLTFGTLSRHFEGLGIPRVSKEGTSGAKVGFLNPAGCCRRPYIAATVHAQSVFLLTCA